MRAASAARTHRIQASMTTRQTLPDDAGHPRTSEKVADAQWRLRTQPAGQAANSRMAPISILSVAEARRIVMRIVG